MSFFRKWKLHYKHKKLSEEWALATSMKDLSENSLSDDTSTSNNPDDTNDDDDLDDTQKSSGISTFDLKYLGSTSIDSEKSKKSTADAIKSVISLSKASRRKNQRVKLMVSPQGIEVLNPQNGETLLRVSIYKISYCSADAAHDHVFAFVGSENVNVNSKIDDDLSCHVFYCAKRKIAHDVTLTVARCFENAYEVWRETVNRKMLKEQTSCEKIQDKINPKSNNIIVGDNNDAGLTLNVVPIEKDNNQEDEFRELLIDFTPSDIRSDLYEKDGREYLQNTWVSFDDDNNNNNNQRNTNEFGRLLVC